MFQIVLRGLVVLLMSVVVALSASSARADGFQGAYHVANWVNDGIQDGYTLKAPTPLFRYDVDLGDPGSGVPFRTATFQRPSQFAQTVTFSWRYTGFHAFFKAQAQLQVFTTINGNTQTIDLVPPGTSVFGDFEFSGTVTIDIGLNGAWGFIAGGMNEDSNSRLRGKVEISDFNPLFVGFIHDFGLWSAGPIPQGSTAVEVGPQEIGHEYYVFTGNNQPVPYRTTKFWVNAEETGTITLDWAYYGWHAFSGAVATLQLFAMTPTGETTTPLVGPAHPVFSDFFLSGTDTSIDVHAGMPWGIIVGGAHNDVQAVIRGKTRLKNLRFAPPPPHCPGDANGDDTINFADVTSVLSNWGATYTPGSAGAGDANNDGIVNFSDITAVLSNWGGPC